MLLSVRIYTHPRGDEMDEEGGDLIRALSPITNKEQKSMAGSEPCAKREELGQQFSVRNMKKAGASFSIWC